MSKKAKAAMGTALKIGTYSVGELTSIGGLELSADTIDVTTLDSADGYREFIGGLKDAGEVALSGFLDATDTNGQKALLTNFNAGTAASYSIVFPTAISASWNFDGIVTAWATGAELEDGVTFESTIKVTGKPTFD